MPQCPSCKKKYNTFGYLERHLSKIHHITDPLFAADFSQHGLQDECTGDQGFHPNDELDSLTTFPSTQINPSDLPLTTQQQFEDIIPIDYDFDTACQLPVRLRSPLGSNADSDGEHRQGDNSESEDSFTCDVDHTADPSAPVNSTAPANEHVSNAGPSVRTEFHSGNPGEGFPPTDGNAIVPPEDWNPWLPFNDSFDFKVAKTLITNRVTKTAIDSMFASGMLRSSELSFSSARDLYKKLARMGDDLGIGQSSWSTGEEVLANGEKVSYLFRKPIRIVEYLLMQRAYRDEMVYAPVKEFNSSNDHRLYSEMHTADWWWNTQSSLPRPNGTVVPLILGSDATHLTEFSGGKKAWPVYLTIGNIKSSTRNKPSSAAIVLLALLPVSASTLDDRDVVHRILTRILGTLNQYSSCGVILKCSDNLSRICFPRVVAWIADHLEYCTLYQIKKNGCPLCEVKLEDLGSGRIGSSRNYNRYKQLCDRIDKRSLDAANVHPMKNSIFWGVDHIDSNHLWKPDKLHVILLGIFTHYMEWLDNFLKEYDRAAEFNAVWGTMDLYPGVWMPNKTYNAVGQWKGKEIRSFSRIVYVCLVVALQHPSATERSIFKAILDCTRSFVDFAAMADYKSHDEDTLGYMSDYLKDFHKHKDVFLRYRAGKTARAAARAAGQELHTRLNEEQDTRGVSSRKRQRINIENRTLVEEERIAVLEQRSHFNFPKIHLLSHFVDSVRQFGSISMWSTESMESAHKYQIKEGYRASNRNSSYEVQSIEYYLRKQAMNMRCMNLTGYARDGFITDGMADTLDLLDQKMKKIRNQVYKKGDPVQIASISRLRPFFQRAPDYSRRTFLSLIRFDSRKSPINCVQDVQNYYNLPNLSVHLEKYFQKLDKSGISSPTGSTDYLAVELYRKLRIPRDNLDGSSGYHDVCASGPKMHYGRMRSDWAWYVPDARNKEIYGVLNGHLPSKCLAFLKIRWESNIYRLVYVRRSTPHSVHIRSRDLHDLPSVTYTEATHPEINSVKSLYGRASLVRHSPSSRNWFVNTRIDIVTWNMFEIEDSRIAH
jgi:hypothetical protein